MNNSNFLSHFRWLAVLNYFLRNSHDFDHHLIRMASENDLLFHIITHRSWRPLEIHSVSLIESKENIFYFLIESALLNPRVIDISISIRNENVRWRKYLFQIDSIDMVK